MRRKNITSQMMKTYIVDALLILMKQKPYSDISIGELTDKAGVNRSTYYRNFKSKEDIIKCFFINLMDGYLEETSPNTSMRDYLAGMFHTFLNCKAHIMIIYEQGMASVLSETLTEYFAERLPDKMQYNFTEKFEIYYHIGGIFNTFMLWFSNDMNPSPEELADLAIKVQTPNLRPMLL